MNKQLIFFLSLLSLSLARGATYVIDTTSDSLDDFSTNTLRGAIAAANASSATDSIHFNLPGPTPHVIKLAGALPPLAQPATIDGWTQPDYVNKPVVVLDGQSKDISCLVLEAANCTIRGLSIIHCGAPVSTNSYGIIVKGRGSVIEGNFIGVDATGETAAGNRSGGILVDNAAEVSVGGDTAKSRNVVCGNGRETQLGAGIHIRGIATDGVYVHGNNVGLSASGLKQIENGPYGILARENARNIRISGFNGITNRIVGSRYGIGLIDTTAANISYASIGVDIDGASFRMMSGIQLQNAQQTVIGQCVIGSCETGIRLENSSGCTIGNCRIGVDLTGRIGRPNSKGIFIDPASNINTIGGSSGRNIISGNLTGLEIHGSGNIIQNNFIGPDVTGNHRLTNVTAAVGIRMESGSFNTIGGDAATLRNVIGGFSSWGIIISGGVSNGHFIKQNLIGVGIDGVTPLPNGAYGVTQMLDPYYTGGGIITFGGMPVYISSCTVMNNNGYGIVIGYTVTGGVNQKRPTFIDNCIISKNKLQGVLVLDSPADLTRTLIFDNGGPGQLLTSSAVRPRILSWQGAPNSLFVDADFQMAAGKPFRFEIMATDNCGAGVTLGFPMLRKWIGAVSGTSDSSGVAHISTTLPTAIPDGWTPAVFVVADGNSSEAQCAECNELVEFPAASGDTLPPGEVGQPYTLPVSLADKAVVFSPSLPAGLSYQNGVISGIPQNPGENNLSFVAFNSRNTNCWDAREFTVIFNAPQAEARLSSTGNFELMIPSQTQLPGYVLQNAANLQPPIVWQTIDPPPTNAAGNVTVPPTNTQSYYRLAPSGSVAR